MRRRRSRGQSLVEFSLVIPLFLTLLVGVVDMGRVVWATSALGAAAREGARYAIVHGGTASTFCPAGPPGPAVTSDQLVVTASCPYPSPSKQAVVNAATNAAIGVGGALTVTVCYGTGCSGDTDAGTNARGTPVTVVVSTNIGLVIPSLLGFTSFNLSGTSTMLVNH